MEIRKATTKDYITLVRATQNKHLDYLTASHIAADIRAECCYIMIEKNKPIAMVSRVYDTTYNYYAIKRISIFRKENKGRGITEKLIDFLISITPDKIGCTPWDNNCPMRHILEKKGFILQYIFSEKWCFYLRSDR